MVLLRRWARSRAGLRVVCLLVVGAVVVSGLTASVRMGEPVPEVVAVAPDEASAVAAAWSQGSRVEVASLRTATQTVYANPGGTMTAELSVVPTRVRRGDGWVPIDTTVVRRADGTVAPRAAEGDLVLSGGGSGVPLARLSRDGRSYATYWPGVLPVPRVDGSVVTYPEVLPGVDLVMRVERSGYQQHVVVKTLEAARNPALARIALRVEAPGLRVSADDTGAVRVVDEAGEPVFVAPPSLMWDSSGRTEGPAASRSAAVRVAVAGGALVLEPDRGFLADPAVVFPVTIDPLTTTWSKSNWATVLAGKATTPYWWTSGSPPWAQVGQCYTASGECNGIGEARAYFQFNTSSVAGKHIISTEFRSRVVYSPNCSARNHELYVVPGGQQITPGTSWSNMPGGGRLRTVSVPGVWDSCPGAKPVGFGFPAGHQADGIGAVTTFFLKAESTTDQLAWRKYDPAHTELSVTYNTKPSPPTRVITDPPTPEPCRWCGGRSYLGDANVRLLATLNDADKDLLLPKWRMQVDGTITEWDGVRQKAGATHDTTVDLRNKHDKTVQWWVHGDDGTDISTGVYGRSFSVDRHAPAAAPDVESHVYPDDNRWHGGVGVPGTFTFSANGVTDVDHYLYGWSNPPSTKVDADALGGNATVTLTPPGDGPRTLYVMSKDRARHASPVTEYRVYVRAGNSALAQWSFEGNAQDTAFLGDRHGTFTGTPTFVPGTVGSSVELSRDSMSAPNTVDTKASFTVAAWVRLNETVGWHTAVSQSGTSIAAFQLGYEATQNRWFFVMPREDRNSPATDMAWSGAVQPGNWTHLAGVYDAGLGEIRLYVNGVQVGRVAHTSTWTAEGSVQVGNALVNGGLANHWLGDLDEVQVYDRVVTGNELSAAVSGADVQVAHWRFDDEEGATARNGVEGGPMAVLADGASFDDEEVAVNGSLRLTGAADSYAATTGQVVATDQSFSVGAWVKLQDRSRIQTVVSQDGEYTCGFCLRYEPGTGDSPGDWVFSIPRSDDVAPASYDTVRVPATQDLDDPVHLTAVYDVAAEPWSAMRLYVNGVASGSAARGAGWNARGPLNIGRALVAGNPGNFLNGWIDEVRVYSRAVSADEVAGIVVGDGVTSGTWLLDGNADDSTLKNHGTVGGDPEWAAGQSSNPNPGDLAVKLNGSNQYVTASHPVDTHTSFSVTAWVRLDTTGTTATAVSQDAANTAGFRLQALSDGRWTFAALQGDGVTVSTATSVDAATQAGVWTHLAGVYSAADKQLRLYINGAPVGTAQQPDAANAAGAVQIGRAKLTASTYGQYFPGAVDDVNVYSRALFADEVNVMAGRDLALVHHWQLDETSGRNAADSVGTRGGTLAGDAAFGPGRVGNSVTFDGAGDSVSTTGIDLRTDQSFTVGAWVYLDPQATCDLEVVTQCADIAVSADGGQTSKFRLGRVVDMDVAPWGNWFFEMPLADTGGAVSPLKAAISVEPSLVGTWVHLAGAYDAQTKRIWLYVNGESVDDETVAATWQATGGLQIGRGKAGGEPGQHWRGQIDDVRVYTGLQDKYRVDSWVRSYPTELPALEAPDPDAGYWTFDEGSGETAADTSGTRRDMTLHGASWRPARSAWGGQFDGVGAYAETAGPVVDTTGSFSVAAWAAVFNTSGVGTVVAQDGPQSSVFAVQYRASDGRWVVRVPTATGTVTLTSVESVKAGYWDHLAVTYDASLDRLRLYVNGALSAAQVDVGMVESTGPLSVGRSRVNGEPAEFLGGGVDDVRAFSNRVLTDGEVRKIYDDVHLAVHGYWRFDGDGTDTSWRNNPTTLTGTPTYSAGMNDQAASFDGEGEAATAQMTGVPMTGSFTVSAWANLNRTDRVQTVLGEDGTRMSGYVLQYRPELNRWVFGGPTQDADGASLVAAASAQPPTPNTWTHLTGVYDYPARQVRLYVDGQLAGSRNNVFLWAAWGGFTIGRGKVAGQPASFFSGLIDEVTTDVGAAADSEIASRAAYPAPPVGQVGRFVNSQGDSYTSRTDVPAPAGYHFAASLGGSLPADATGTRMLYACLFKADVFTSADPNCEGQTSLGEIGPVYATQPTGLATVPLYRCYSVKDHFESLDAGCEGVPGASLEFRLGYTVAYGRLTRYNNPVGWDHFSSIHGAPPGYRRELSLGVVSLTPVSGGQELFSCKDGIDTFLSTDPACEGGTVLATAGWAWTQPPDGLPSRPLYQCSHNQEIFESLSDTCEGWPVERELGHVLTAVPAMSPAPEPATAAAAEQQAAEEPEQVAGTRPPFPIVVGWTF
ncbi:LamG domain-containing protein [Actinophytocola glycyrrhizae]|uniref:LamG domain-containing protein n=1 Tax=Actinophytocola glycyrrhizae TaxID=2044873 RepID=A0ABV9SBF8_9PSEU